MEWERKFYDIVKETESNLANARQKLRGRGLVKETHDHEEYTIYPKPALAKGGKAVSAPASAVQWQDEVSKARRQLGLSSPSNNMPSTNDAACNAVTTQSSMLMELLDKIDAQNLVIQKLERLVRTLDTERDQYRRQIRDLRSEVGSMSTRMNESRISEPHVEVQLDLMRREVKSEIQRLQSMLNTSRTTTLYSGMMERSLRDMKDNIIEEMDDLRKDLGSISQRVGRLELDVTAHSQPSHRDFHSHPGPRDFKLTPERTRLETSYTSRTVPDTSFQRSYNSAGGQHQMQELRVTVSNLHSKLDQLENRIAASRVAPTTHVPTTHSPSTQVPTTHVPLWPNGFRAPTKQVSSSLFDDDLDSESKTNSDLDDLDLSGDLDLDLSDGSVSIGVPDDGDSLSDDIEDLLRGRKGNKHNKGTLAKLSSDTGLRVDRATSAIKPVTETVGTGFDIDMESDRFDLSSAFELDSLDGVSGEVKLEDL